MGNMSARAKIMNMQPKKNSKSHKEKEAKRAILMSKRIVCEKCGKGKKHYTTNKGIIIAKIVNRKEMRSMFLRKQKEIDKLNKRCVELAEQLRDSNFENKQLKELRLMEVRNNTKILKQNNEKTELIQKIESLLIGNKYNKADAVLNKIKELVRDYQSKN